MQKIFNSFYAKISIIFLVLLLIMGAVQSYLTVNSWKAYYNEADQRLNLRLARDMARELEPSVRDSLDLKAVEHAIHYIMILNPKIEIYLLDDQGKILAFFAEPDKKVKSTHVALTPVNAFLSEGDQRLIVGDDPRNPGVKKPFSAAPLHIGPDTDGYLYVIIGSEQYDKALSSTRENYVYQTVVKSLVITVVLTAITGLILFGLLTGRLRSMSSVLSRFEKGDYRARLEDNHKDEIARVAQTFNRMAETIEANIEELKKTDTLRRELIANVSHDLRSPLASIRGYLETLQIKKDQLSEEEKQNYLNIILESSHSLEKLVGELFELSKLDANQIVPQMEPFLLKDLVYEVKMKLQPRAEKAGVAIKIDIPDTLPQVYADVALIERVLTNLLENAIRYSPRGSTVTIDTDFDGEGLRVRVKDTGPGIEAGKLPYIFDRFYRVEGSRSGKTGGTGLGLAIAKKIMEVHKSALLVASEKGKGSTFSFRLNTFKTA